DDPDVGYDPLLTARMRATLPVTAPRHTRIITNAGAANPLTAGWRITAVARELGLQTRVAVLTGDDVTEVVRRLDPVVWQTGCPFSESPEDLVSANAYLGTDAIRSALGHDPDVVVTGRVADPALY